MLVCYGRHFRSETPLSPADFPLCLPHLRALRRPIVGSARAKHGFMSEFKGKSSGKSLDIESNDISLAERIHVTALPIQDYERWVRAIHPPRSRRLFILARNDEVIRRTPIWKQCRLIQRRHRHSRIDLQISSSSWAQVFSARRKNYEILQYFKYCTQLRMSVSVLLSVFFFFIILMLCLFLSNVTIESILRIPSGHVTRKWNELETFLFECLWRRVQGNFRSGKFDQSFKPQNCLDAAIQKWRLIRSKLA